LKAFAAAFPQGLEQAVLVGSALFGEDGYEQEVKSFASEAGLGERVEFRGFRRDIAAELARMDVLVHASTIPEPFGQVVVEGMAAGIPVVAANAGGPAEVVTDGVDGVLYPPGDVDALAHILRCLAADPALRVRIGGAGLETSRRYAPEVIADQIQAIYEKVADRAGAGPP
jgi:glycosyltransferase involved in cell wall biosynthesis